MERKKIVVMDMKSIAEYVKDHYDLPPDSRFKGVKYNSGNGKVYMEFEHQTFDMVKTVPVVEKKEESKDSDSGKESKTAKKK